KIDYPDHSVRRLEFGFQDQRIPPITLHGTVFRVRWSDLPPSVSLIPQQSGKQGPGVEARHAKPVDRTVLADQCSRFQIADKAVILELHRKHTIAPAAECRSISILDFGSGKEQQTPEPKTKASP